MQINYGSSKDPIVVIISLVFYAMPVFFTAPLLILVFALQLDLVPLQVGEGFSIRE